MKLLSESHVTFASGFDQDRERKMTIGMIVLKISVPWTIQQSLCQTGSCCCDSGYGDSPSVRFPAETRGQWADYAKPHPHFDVDRISHRRRIHGHDSHVRLSWVEIKKWYKGCVSTEFPSPLLPVVSALAVLVRC